MGERAQVRVGRPGRWIDRAGLALGLLCTGILWLVIGLRIDGEFRHASAVAHRTTSTLARTLEAEVAGRLRTLDTILRYGRVLRAADPAGFSVPAWIGQDPDGDIVQAGVIGPDGNLREALTGALREPVFLGDRPHIASLLAEPAPDRLVISAPLVGRTTGRESINLVRPLLDAGGGFAGVLYLSVDTASFSRLYRRLDLPDGVIGLIGLDGVVRARVPGPDRLIGAQIPEEVLASLRGAGAESSRRARSPLDGVERFSTLRRVEGYPLAVSVAVAADKVLAGARRERLELIGLGCLVTLLIGIVWLGFSRRRQAERMFRAQLEASLAHVGPGVMMLDPAGRVAVINPQVAGLLDLPPGLAVPGRPVSEIVAWQEQAGEFGGDPAPLTHVSSFGGPGTPPFVTERTRPDGTILQIRTAYVGDGSHVRTFTDVTEARRSAAAIAAARDRALAAEAALAAALENVPHGVILVGTDNRVQIVNGAAVDLIGLPRDVLRPGIDLEEVLRRQVEAGEIDPDETAIAQTWAAIRARSGALPYERVKPDGRAIEVRTTFLADGRFIRTYTDVTARHAALRAEAAARDEALASRAALAAAFEKVPHGVLLVGADQKVQIINRIALELMALPPELARPGADVREILRFQLERGDLAEVPRVTQAAQAAIEGEEPPLADYERRTPDGRVVEVRTTHVGDGRIIRTFTDVTDRHAALRTQESSRAALEAAFENAPLGIALIGADRRLQFVNRTAIELLDLPAALARPGTDAADILRMQLARGDLDAMPDLARRAAGPLDRLPHDHPPYERRTRDGRMMEVRARVLPDERVVRTLTDVTERHAALRAQETARIAAEAAVRSRTEFLAVVSHELRTPLNAVIGLSELLLARGPRPEQVDDLRMVAEAGRHLLALVDDILDVTRLERGRAPLREERFELRSTLEAMAALAAPRAAAKGLAFRATLDPMVPAMALGDQDRLRQVLLKLLDNAVKFTETGSVTLGAAVEQAEGDALLRLTVADTGIGIPREAEARLFEPFAQADSSAARRFGGLGLGLAVCRLLLESMGGTIAVESLPGAGSTFRVAMPLRLPPEDQPAPARAGLRVLVAEDVATNRAVALALLKRLGHEAEAVEDGAAAVAAVQARPYDLVLMDIMMPGMDGIEGTRAIRALPGPAGQVPIIAVTAHDSEETERACREAGMNRFESKPLEAERLRAAIDAVLPAWAA